ncbi:MAG: fused MFS/spermidine synthase, partial [Planctomycetota bacterium]
MTQPDAAATPEPVSTAAVLAAAAVGGAAVMAVELSAVRLVAPWFGSSLAVWTNVLGVVLTALALGYLLGARLARGRRPVRALALLFALSSGLVASTPWLADPICGAFLPDRVALSEAGALIVNGSLAVSLALFLPSATLLGAIGPLSVEAVQRRRGGHAGTAGGQVLCVSTLGSLAGTFGTSHLLLPELGVAGTFLAAGVTLAGLGAVLALGTRRRAEAALALLLGAAALVELLRDVDPTASADPERTVLAERDSAYQRVRVVELSDGSRRLEVNERTDSFQSVWFPEPGLLPAGFYYNDFALPAWW